MKTMKILKLIFNMIFVLTFVSCNNLLGKINIKQQEEYGKIYGDKKEIFILTHFENFESENNTNISRGVIPAFYPEGDNQTLIYRYTATATDEDTITGNSESSSFKISLKTNTVWSVKIEALKKDATEETIVLLGQSTIDTRKLNAKYSIPLKLYTDSSAKKGSLNLIITCFDASIKYTYVLKNLAGEVVRSSISAQTFTYDDSLSKNKSVLSIGNLNPGNYYLQISFSKENRIRYYIYTTVTIFAGLESNQNWTTASTSINLGVNSNPSITMLDITANQLSQEIYYVKGADSTAFPSESQNANDNNMGGPYTPLKTVEEAVSRCTENTKDYIIYIDGTCTEKLTSRINQAKSITIEPLLNTATIKSNLTPESEAISLFNVSNRKKLIIKNVVIDGDNKSNIRAINNNSGSTLELENCRIQNFTSTSGVGAGIYNENSTVNMTSCTIQDCSVGTDTSEDLAGGGIYNCVNANNSNSKVTMTNCTILRCQVKGDYRDENAYGGGIANVKSPSYSSSNVETFIIATDGNKCQIRECKSSAKYPIGLAIYNSGGKVTVQNSCDIVLNGNEEDYKKGDSSVIYNKGEFTFLSKETTNDITVSINYNNMVGILNEGKLYFNNDVECDKKTEYEFYGNLTSESTKGALVNNKDIYWQNSKGKFWMDAYIENVGTNAKLIFNTPFGDTPVYMTYEEENMLYVKGKIDSQKTNTVEVSEGIRESWETSVANYIKFVDMDSNDKYLFEKFESDGTIKLKK